MNTTFAWVRRAEELASWSKLPSVGDPSAGLSPRGNSTRRARYRAHAIRFWATCVAVGGASSSVAACSLASDGSAAEDSSASVQPLTQAEFPNGSYAREDSVPNQQLFRFTRSGRKVLLETDPSIGVWGTDYFGYWSKPFPLVEDELSYTVGLVTTTYRFTPLGSARIEVNRTLSRLPYLSSGPPIVTTAYVGTFAPEVAAGQEPAPSSGSGQEESGVIAAAGAPSTDDATATGEGVDGSDSAADTSDDTTATGSDAEAAASSGSEDAGVDCGERSGGQSGSFGTNLAYCFVTQDAIHGWGCSNFDGRSLLVNGVDVACGAALPAPQGGSYRFEASAGSYAWASIYWW